MSFVSPTGVLLPQFEYAGFCYCSGLKKFFVHIVCFFYVQFYFQNGRPPPKELKEQFLSRVNHIFEDHLDGLKINGEMHV